MMTRPKPRTARVGLRASLVIVAAAALLLPMASARSQDPTEVTKTPAPVEDPNPVVSVASGVLSDSDNLAMFLRDRLLENRRKIDNVRFVAKHAELRSEKYRQTAYEHALLLGETEQQARVTLDDVYVRRIERFALDREYRGRVERVVERTDSNGNRIGADDDSVVTWDGKTAIKLRKEPESGLFPYTVTLGEDRPMECSQRYSQPWIEFVRWPARMLADAVSNGVRVEAEKVQEEYRVELDYGGGKTVYVIDPAQGFSVVSGQRVSNGRLLASHRAEFQEVSPGVWFPIGGEMVGGNAETGDVRTTVEILQVSVNDQDFYEGLYHVDFPKGTRVSDKRTGLSYVVGETPREEASGRILGDAIGLPDDEDLEARMESARHLVRLGKALLIYANDYDDTFPPTLQEARDHINERTDFAWVLANVTYRGRDIDPRDDPARVLAYDRTLLEKRDGTNVLYLDLHVAFEGVERLGELGIGPVRGSLPNIFIMSSSHAGFDVFGEVLSRTRDWTWNKTGRHHAQESYDEIFDGTHNRTSHDLLVLVFTWDADDRIPLAYEDLLPMPWPDIEHRLRLGRTVERSKETRGLHVIVLAAPRGEPLKQLIAQTRLLDEAKRLARSPVTGCDLAIDKFEVRADPDLSTYAAVASIRNRGTATSPKLTVNFYRGDPATVRPMPQRVSPIKSDKVRSQSSLPFALREGVTEVHVVLDPANVIEESDEANNRASLRMVIRDGQIVEQSIALPATASVSLEARGESRARLTDLGKVLLFYTVDHDGKLPEKIDDVRDDVRMAMWWLAENLAYLGQGMTTRDNPERPIAYDKTLIQSGTGTNVLYLNSQVVFESPTRLAELGIKPVPKSAEEIQETAAIQARVTVLSHLKQLALAALMYASDHDGASAERLEALKLYVGDEALFAWAEQNAEYVGKGAKPAAGNQAFKTPLIYWKTPAATISGTAVAFLDGHAEFVDQARCEELGIEIER
jgi:CARDB